MWHPSSACGHNLASTSKVNDSLISYYVITVQMSKVFEGKVRRLGNSMAVIIPREILEEAGAKEGDVVKLSLPIPRARREEALKRITGIDSEAEPFIREKRDRF